MSAETFDYSMLEAEMPFNPGDFGPMSTGMLGLPSVHVTEADANTARFNQ